MKPQKSNSQRRSDPDRDPDFAGAEAAMKRAAKRAHRRAAENGSLIAVFKDGEIKWVAPDDDALS